MRQEALDRYPRLAEALNELANVIDEDTMRDLVRSVDIDGESPREVATRFLAEKDAQANKLAELRAALAAEHANVIAVKEAAGSVDQVARIRPLHDRDPGILTQLPVELAIAHIHSIDVGGATLQVQLTAAPVEDYRYKIIDKTSGGTIADTFAADTVTAAFDATHAAPTRCSRAGGSSAGGPLTPRSSGAGAARSPGSRGRG